MNLYETAYKGEPLTKRPVEPMEAMEINDLLMIRENLSYLDLEEMGNREVEMLNDINRAIYKGEKRKQQEEQSKAK